MSWFSQRAKRLVHSGDAPIRTTDIDAPPQWTPAPEVIHPFGLHNDAPEDEYKAAEAFCSNNPLEPPKLLSSDIVDRIDAQGCAAWGIEWPATVRFVGHIENENKGGSRTIKIFTDKTCQDACLLSDLPVAAGLYDIQGKSGVYYEILVHRMDGLIAIGTACKPYPNYRLPGWNRLSAGLHLDDRRKFFEDPDGGRDYTDQLNSIRPGDTIGCGYDFSTAAIFFTHNGVRLPTAFSGVYLPRDQYDVYAAIGVEGRNDFEVNFGAELFRWKEGNEWAWRVEGHVGRLNSCLGGVSDELPSYDEIRGKR